MFSFPVFGQGDHFLSGGKKKAVYGRLETKWTETREDSEYQNFNDFYILSNGKKKNFLRKKDYFLIINRENAVNTVNAVTNIQRTMGGRVNIIKNHSFYKHIMVQTMKDESIQETIESLYANSPTDSFVSPVLSTHSKDSEIAVVPEITIQIGRKEPTVGTYHSASIDHSRVIYALEALDLTVIKKANYSKNVYRLRINENISDVSRIFELTRQAATIANVKWAEPNFIVSQRNAYMPDDPLYPDQWHLDNNGQNGGLADADVDAPEGWNKRTGVGTVIAIHDTGVDLTHEDISIWINPGESGDGKETNGIDDDDNGYIDDYRGWDFDDDDNNPSPDSASYEFEHGTACAGVAAAIGDNHTGVAGSAYGAKVLPIKMTGMDCFNYADSIRYAGRYADVVSCNWTIGACESEISAAIFDVTFGNISGARRGAKGSPVLFPTGNAASGWVQFQLSEIPSGPHTYKWRFTKDQAWSSGYDTVWLDDIKWPAGGREDFESNIIGSVPTGFTSSGDSIWSVVSDGIHARGATGNAVQSGLISHNQSTDLERTYDDDGGILTFWAWVSCEYGWDLFQFYVDGDRYFQFSPGQYYSHQNETEFPASDPNSIAVGASTDGGPGQIEERSYYSQFGPEIDFVAPSDGGNQKITTTDIMGESGSSSTSYTDGFGGTSSATALAAGIAATIIGENPVMNADEVRTALRDGAEKIGPYEYVDGRNDYYGFGRVSLDSDWKVNKSFLSAPIYLLLLP